MLVDTEAEVGVAVELVVEVWLAWLLRVLVVLELVLAVSEVEVAVTVELLVEVVLVPLVIVLLIDVDVVE